MGDLDPDLKQDPMFAYQPKGRVIYTKSFSKTLLPGLRLGLVVLPEKLIEGFTRAKFASDVHTPVITQGALEIYLINGMFAAHIEKIRKLYRKKGLMLRESYQIFMPEGTIFTCPTSGFYSIVRLPSHVKADRLIERLGKRDDELRLCVSHVEENMIRDGIEVMGQTIQEMVAERKKGVIWR